MISTDLNAALRELEEALGADGIVEEILDATGRRMVAYDSESHGGLHRGGWRDDTGELARSYGYEVAEGTLYEFNEAGHARYVQDRAGYSVFTAVDSGVAVRMLQEEAGKALTDRTL